MQSINKKIIIEVRANEYTMRESNPNVPWMPDEIGRDAAACREAGAASFHFHPRTYEGAPDLSYETYRKIIACVRDTSDILIQPTLGAFVQTTDPIERLQNIAHLAEDGLRPDFAPLDMGSTNADILDEISGRFLSESHVYQNSTGTLRYLAERLRKLSVKPYLHIWNIPQLRLAGVFHRMGFLDGPLWIGLSHGGESAPIYHPANEDGLRAYLGVFPTGVPVEWTANSFRASLLRFAPAVIEAGGHLSIGIGDHSYVEDGSPTNAELVHRAVKMAKSMGREPATPEEAKTLLGMC